MDLAILIFVQSYKHLSQILDSFSMVYDQNKNYSSCGKGSTSGSKGNLDYLITVYMA